MFDLKSSSTHNIFIRIQLNIPADSFLGIKRKLESLTFRVSKRCFGTKLLNKQELLPNEAVIHLGDKRAKIVVMRFGPWGCFSPLQLQMYRCFCTFSWATSLLSLHPNERRTGRLKQGRIMSFRR
jgi:hypothetical protein